MHLHVAQVVQEVFLFAADAQHVDVELAAEVCLLDRAVDDARGTHQHDFRNADVVEVQRRGTIPGILFRGVPVHQGEAAFPAEQFHLSGVPRHVEYVAFFQQGVRRGELLHRVQEAVLRGSFSPYLQDVEPVFVADAQPGDGLPDDGGVAVHAQAEQIARQAVFLDQLRQRFPLAGIFVRFPFFRQEPSGEGQQHEGAYGDAYQSYRQEREERERPVARLFQGVGNDKVGRRANEGHHAPHAAGKGQGHEQAARADACAHGHAYHDGQHERHRARVADKGADGRGDQHDQQEQAQFAFACQLEDAAAYHLGKSCLEDGSPYHKQPHHHDDDRIGEARQPFFRGQDVEYQQDEQGADGYQVGAYFPAHEEDGGKRQGEEGNQHRATGWFGVVCRLSFISFSLGGECCAYTAGRLFPLILR